MRVAPFGLTTPFSMYNMYVSEEVCLLTVEESLVPHPWITPHQPTVTIGPLRARFLVLLGVIHGWEQSLSVLEITVITATVNNQRGLRGSGFEL